MQLSDILLQSSEAALALQAPDGSFPAGWNGPYHDVETPVRNTAHWLVSLLKAHEISGAPKLKEAAQRAAAYLASPAARPMRATFFCRTNPQKDFCNGLIGQAWTIEALVTAAHALDDSQYLDLAREVFLLHPFDSRTGLWRCVNVDGSYTLVDMTLNHQLFFAASGAMIESAPQSAVGSQVARFLDMVRTAHMRVDPTGRIIHFIPSPRKGSVARQVAARLLAPVRRRRPNAYMVHKEIGYHAFNLYALSVLRQQLPSNALWRSEKLLSTLQFTNQPEYVRGLEENKYGYPYNPPGFEVAFALQAFAPVFSAPAKPAAWWVEQQLRRSYDMGARLMNRATEDQPTLAARLYEATRLQNMELQLG